MVPTDKLNTMLQGKKMSLVELFKSETFNVDDDEEEMLTDGLTLRDLLFQQKSRSTTRDLLLKQNTRSVTDSALYKLPKLGVVDISELPHPDNINKGRNVRQEDSLVDIPTFNDDLLLQQKSQSALEREVYKLPKLNVVDITEVSRFKDKNGTSTPMLSGGGSAASLNMNQRMNQMKAQKELTSVQMYSQRMVRLRMTQNNRRQALPWFGSTLVVPQGLGFYRVRCPTFHGVSTRTVVVPEFQEYLSLGSSSTPTVPYSTADILYGSEVNNRNQLDDARQNSYLDLDKNRDLQRQKSKELEQHPNNRRPSSKSGSRKSLTIEAVALDKEDSLKNLTSSLPPAKVANHFRPNGIRSLKGEPQPYPAKTNGALPSRDQDDLVAMGTLWSPNNNTNSQQQQQPPPSASSQQQQQQQQQQMSSRQNSLTTNSNTNSFPAKVASSVHHSLSTSNNTMTPQRKYTSNNVRPIVVQNNVSGKKNNLKDQEADPKYTDPMIGAPASFQQRLIELGALEGDTVRWERTKRLKKKKQDRDS